MEATLEEAERLVDACAAAKRGALGELVGKAGAIKAQLKFVSEALRELMGLPGS